MNTANAEKMKNIANFKALPQDKTRALSALIGISEQLFSLAERETQALVQDDMGTFAILQDEKFSISQKYADAAAEFRNRLPEFRAADPGLLDRLERLQNDLHDKLYSNTRVVENMFNHSKGNVHNSLLSVQELSDRAPVSFDKNTTTKTGAVR